MKDLIKVKIDKSESNLSWYRNQIGAELIVSDNKDGYFELEGHRLFLLKSDCIIISSSKEVLDNSPEPKLIAKAGEWVRLLDKGEFTGNLNIFEGEIPLIEDLYEGQELKNGKICNTHLFKMKFEKCQEPIPFCSRTDELFRHLCDRHGLTLDGSELNEIFEIVNKATGKIEVNMTQDVFDLIAKEEKPIDKVTIEMMNAVLSMCSIQLHPTILDKIIDCVELIEEKGEGVNIGDVLKMKAEWNKQ